MQPNKIVTFFVQPLEQEVVQEDPIYETTRFVRTSLKKDLSYHKERESSADYPEATTIEDFFHTLIKNGDVDRCGWVRVEADIYTEMDKLWYYAMSKLGNKKLYCPPKFETKTKVGA